MVAKNDLAEIVIGIARGDAHLARSGSGKSIPRRVGIQGKTGKAGGQKKLVNIADRRGAAR